MGEAYTSLDTKQYIIYFDCDGICNASEIYNVM